jgi:LacI family transcriptional regulator
VDRSQSSVTLSDVAKEAGVSLATASRVINGTTRRVGEDVRERVLAAAHKLDYTPNGPAQATARGRSNAVALVVHDIADPYFASISAGVMRAADEHRLLVSIASTLRQPERELAYLASNRGQRSRAVILAGSRVDDPDLNDRLTREIAAYERSGGHVVVISQPTLPVDTVVVENRAGARELATQLLELGYRRFGVLAGPPQLITARDRRSGVLDALSAAGLQPVALTAGEFTRDGGYEAMSRILADGTEVDCVVAVNDVMAVGAMAAARDHGMVLPNDLAVAGFDDIATLRDVNPSLSTVRLPLEALGRMALEMAVTAEPAPPPRRSHVAGDVVIRDSTPPKN